MISQPATAKTTTEAASVRKVAVADLDLTREEDAAVLVGRIHRAARAACLDSYDGWQQYLNASDWYRGCLREASGRAVASLDNPTVTALYQDGRRPIRLAANSPQ